MTETEIGTVTGTETVVGTRKGTEATDTETHVGEAAPEVLEEAITIGVQVCMASFILG